MLSAIEQVFITFAENLMPIDVAQANQASLEVTDDQTSTASLTTSETNQRGSGHDLQPSSPPQMH